MPVEPIIGLPRNAPGEPLLRRLSPVKVAVYGWIFYSVVFLFAPVRVVVGISSGAIFYLVSSYVMFFVGCSFYDLFAKVQNVHALPLRRSYRNFFQFVLFVALIGIGLRVYDRFFVRGVSLVQDVLERKEALASVGSNIFSLGAAALYPFCFVVPFVYFLRARRGERRPYQFWLSLFVFCLPGLNAIVVGSRSIILTTVLLLFLYLLYFGVIRFTARTVIISLGTLLMLLALSSWVFLDRLEAMGLPADVSVYKSSYAYTVQPNEWMTESMNSSQSPLLSEAYFTYLNLSQYVIHGLFEFSYLYANFHGGHTMGEDTFSVYYKLTAFLFRLPRFEERVTAAESNSGVFTTFFGPLYVDFGWFGPIVAFVFGLGAQKLWTSTRRGNIDLLPLFFYAVIVIFLAPVANMITGAEGLFVATSFALYYLSSRIAFPQKALA